MFSSGIPRLIPLICAANLERKHDIVCFGESHGLAQGVAKYDSQSSRTAAIDQDEAADEFYRPVASPKARASRPRPVEPAGNSTRVWPDPTDRDADGREQQDAFLRARRRVPVRRGLLPQGRTGRIVFAVCLLSGLAVLVVLAIGVRNFLRDDPRFRINSGSNIQTLGNNQLTRRELLSVFGSDIGRNVFFIPLGERREDLEKLPWVDHATVMRLLPNQLRVSIVERVPVAFLRTGSTIGLVDADGVLLSMPPAVMAAKHYSFPVVTGIAAQDPLSIRAARMHLYLQFIHDLDSGGEKVSEQLSEVDMSDPEDIRALLPARGSDVLVHFGENDFLRRYKLFQEHLADWQHQYPHLASVDMRFDNQVVLEMAKGAGTVDEAEGTSANKLAPDPPAGHPPVKALHRTATAKPRHAAAAAAKHHPLRDAARSQQ
jgi:cell division protein FtsQ